MLQRSSEEKESEGASMVAWRSSDGGGVLPPAARSRTALLAPFLSQVRFLSLSAHRFLQPSATLK